MQQYFENRDNKGLCDIGNNPVENCVFANERLDANWNPKLLSITNSTFAKMGFKGSNISQCNLSFCVFIDCYFKNAKVEQTKFIGCQFINCNFDSAFFSKCNFEYATFENCFIPYNQMKTNLPINKDNLRASLCKNLEIQCLNLGDVTNYREYLFEEKHAGERHSIKKLFHKGDSYYKKYNFFDGICGLFSYTVSKLSQFLWGYGEKLYTLIRNIVLLICVFSIPYYLSSDKVLCSSIPIKGFWSALYLSACSFFNISDVRIEGNFLNIVWLSENIFGVVFIGMFVTALFRRINKR